ncbi:hypothetical protein ACNOYE_00105 [Nannocystaceae bacterium ST9]
MTTFPGSPITLRGALVSVDFLSLSPLAVISFQYNPHTLTRSFELKAGTSGPEAGQIARAPSETIKLDLELDGADGLVDGADAHGIGPQLAALEELVSRSSLAIIADLVMLNLGTIEVTPPTTKLTLFVWGPKRVLPVVITELSVTEEAHDRNLNPLRAQVKLTLRALNWNDVGQTHPAFGIALAHKMHSEALALLGNLQSSGSPVF